MAIMIALLLLVFVTTDSLIRLCERLGFRYNFRDLAKNRHKFGVFLWITVNQLMIQTGSIIDSSKWHSSAFLEPAAGQILIDGVNISTIGLHDLRSRLSIIPQDPTMFEGTIRSNLDPLEEYTDDKIWDALDKCQLGDEVRSKEGKLDTPVTENGENWSVGQRQLVCLGRVLLKKSKVLVLDEATASVDTATDGMIQQTLYFYKDCSSYYIYLIEEYDSPTKLLEDKSSLFAKLVAEYSMRSSSSFENLAAT
nr:ABC transporter C family member 3-like [Tanacetum cinerariifolium]